MGVVNWFELVFAMVFEPLELSASRGLLENLVVLGGLKLVEK